MQFSVFELSIFCFSSASERLLEMLGTVVAYVDDVLVSLFGFLFLLLWWYQWGLSDISAFSTPSKIPLQEIKEITWKFILVCPTTYFSSTAFLGPGFVWMISTNPGSNFNLGFSIPLFKSPSRLILYYLKGIQSLNYCRK